ncbi:hypothetical protein A7K99_00545 [Tatumella citrea]|uniref:Prepilin leader peptidase/N-methyltransferase n=2 Tax=Tatumella citrea TaxID=53336 RepID=A0A1Y0LEF0_TATCI|nr:hypothetical protein A7K98_00545 [Tatumella citrea]ARU96453.1 hypothetical protein A7K99_00545 [Tatumella citrea]
MPLIVFVFGTLLGSFLCLAGDRYCPRNSFFARCQQFCRPPSHCLTCHHLLRWYDLLPLLSFIWLKGRCRYCRQRITLKLLIMEAGCGSVCLLLYWLHPDPIQLTAVIFFSSLLFLLATIDMRLLLLPDELVFALLWSGLLLGDYFSLADTQTRILGACSGYLALFFLNALYCAWRKTEGIGGGDMKLLAAIGAWCGWQILPSVVVIAAVLTLFVLCCQRRIIAGLQENIPLPFGCYLAVAGWICFVLNNLVNYPPAL